MVLFVILFISILPSLFQYMYNSLIVFERPIFSMTLSKTAAMLVVRIVCPPHHMITGYQSTIQCTPFLANDLHTNQLYINGDIYNFNDLFHFYFLIDQLDVSGTTYNFNDWFRAITLVFDALCFLDERVMVNGITFLMDAKGVAMKHFMFFGFNNCRKQFEVMQVINLLLNACIL